MLARIPDAIRLDIAHPSTEPAKHIRERGCMLLDLVKHCERQLSGSARDDPDRAPPIFTNRCRIVHRQRTQQQRIDHAENRGIGPNPKRERKQRNQCNGRSLEQQPDSMAKIGSARHNRPHYIDLLRSL